MNFAHNIKNNRNNLIPQIYEQDPKQPMTGANTTIPNINNFDINNKINTNLNNNQIGQINKNRMINKNNMINYSPISNPNLYPQNSG